MNYKLWLSRVRDEIELFWGESLDDLPYIPWKDYFHAGLSPGDALKQSEDDGYFIGGE